MSEDDVDGDQVAWDQTVCGARLVEQFKSDRWAGFRDEEAGGNHMIKGSSAGERCFSLA